MNRFTIKDVETLTGIKAHTLRIWESRYDFLKPRRTETNIRYYNNEDLKLLLNFSLLNKEGIKISKLKNLTAEEITRLVEEKNHSSNDISFQVHALVSHMISLDKVAFEKIISLAFIDKGVVPTMIELIFPFLKHVGLLWQSGTLNPAYEHLITNIIRNKLIIAIDSISHSQPIKNPKKFLLFLPENEVHEIGLLFGKYVIRSRGHQTLYLGANTPHQHLQPIIEVFQPDYIFTSITYITNRNHIKQLFDFLSKSFLKTKILVTGHAFLNLKTITHKNILKITSVEDLQTHL